MSARYLFIQGIGLVGKRVSVVRFGWEDLDQAED